MSLGPNVCLMNLGLSLIQFQSCFITLWETVLRAKNRGDGWRENSLIVSFLINCTINPSREGNCWVLFNFGLESRRLQRWWWTVRDSNLAQMVTDCGGTVLFQMVQTYEVNCLLSSCLLTSAPRSPSVYTTRQYNHPCDETDAHSCELPIDGGKLY
jgi:hypothetical protein